MARITNIGRANKIVYGSYASFTFDVDFVTDYYTSTGGINPNWYGVAGAVNSTYTSDPTTGTIVVAGVTITLGAADILTPQTVAKKILSNGVTGWTVSLNPYQTDLVTLTSTTVGHVATPTVSLGTATYIFFIDQTFIDGTAITIGAQDDILVRGKVPITVTVASTGGSTPNVQASVGTDLEQSQGALTYATAVTLSNGAYTFTTPIDYIRMTTLTGNTQATLYITR